MISRRMVALISLSAGAAVAAFLACAPPGQAESAGVSVLQHGLSARMMFLTEEEEVAESESWEAAGGAPDAPDALGAGAAPSSSNSE